MVPSRMAALNQRLLVLLSSMHMMNAQQLWIINSGSQYCRLTQGGTCVAALASSRSGSEACTFSAALDLWSRSTVWSLASCSGCGSLTVGSTIYQAANPGPSYVHIPSGGLVTWQMAPPYSVMSTFELCGTTNGPPTSPPPPIAPPNILWIIQSGSQYCSVTNGGRCVTDGPGSYGNREACTITAATSLIATSTYFETESRYDWVCERKNFRCETSDSYTCTAVSCAPHHFVAYNY